MQHLNLDTSKLSVEEQGYFEQMTAWLKEQQARESQIRNTIETSTEIVLQNRKQLEWHLRGYEKGIKDFNSWIADKGLAEVQV